MNRFFRAMALLFCAGVLHPAQARHATPVELKAAYCEALLKPQVEYLNFHANANDSPPMVAKRAQTISNLDRVTNYLNTRRRFISETELAVAAGRPKKDIAEATIVSKSCLQQCLSEGASDATNEQKSTNIQYCTQFRTCQNPAQARLDQCSAMNWLPY